MANTLLPPEERNLTPEEVGALDHRRYRGLMFLVVSVQFAIICTVLLLWLGSDLSYSPGWMRPITALLHCGADDFDRLRFDRHGHAPRNPRVLELVAFRTEAWPIVSSSPPNSGKASSIVPRSRRCRRAGDRQRDWLAGRRRTPRIQDI